MPIEAIVGSQNGISPPDSLYTRPSPHILIANTTTIVYSQGVYFRCINTAPYPKDLPATFYSEVTTGTTTSTISLGQAYFDGVTATLYTTLLGSGTNRVSVTWPGESRYEGFTTTMVNSISVIPAFSYQGSLIFSTTPSTTNQLLNPTGTLHLSSGTSITGNIRILQNGTSSQTLLQTVSVNNTNTVKFSLNPNLFTKTANNQYQLQAIWDGGFVDSLPYFGTSSNIITQIVTTGTLTLRGPLFNQSRYPSIFTATANTSLVTTATVKFLDGPNVIGQITTIGNSATISINSGTLNSGSHVISALWYGSNPLVVSNNFTTTIVPAVLATISSNINPNPFYIYNQDKTTNTSLVSASITVSGAYAGHAPTGTVNIVDSTSTLATGTLSASTLTNSSVTLTWGPYANHETLGTRNLSIVYPGDIWNLANSQTTTLTISKPIPAISFSMFSENNFYLLGNVTYTATKPDNTLLDNNITFLNQTTGVPVGSVPFVGNTATYVAYPGAVGTYTFVAVYPGDTYHQAFTSTGITKVITKVPQAFSFSAVPTVPYNLTWPDGTFGSVIIPGDTMTLTVASSANSSLTNVARTFQIKDNGNNITTPTLAFNSYNQNSTSTLYTVAGTLPEGNSGFSAYAPETTYFLPEYSNTVTIYKTTFAPTSITWHLDTSIMPTGQSFQRKSGGFSRSGNGPLNTIYDRSIVLDSQTNIIGTNFVSYLQFGGGNLWGKKDTNIYAKNLTSNITATIAINDVFAPQDLTSDYNNVFNFGTSGLATATTFTLSTPADKINQSTSSNITLNTVWIDTLWQPDYPNLGAQSYIGQVGIKINDNPSINTSTSNITYNRNISSTYTKVWGQITPYDAQTAYGYQSNLQVSGPTPLPSIGRYWPAPYYQGSLNFMNMYFNTSSGIVIKGSPTALPGKTQYTNSGTLTIKLSSLTSATSIGLILVKEISNSGFNGGSTGIYTSYFDAVDNIKTDINGGNYTPYIISTGTSTTTINWTDTVPLGTTRKYFAVFVDRSVLATTATSVITQASMTYTNFGINIISQNQS